MFYINFPKTLPTDDPKSENSEKAWKNFQENTLTPSPIFWKKNQDSAIRITRRAYAELILIQEDFADPLFQPDIY